MQNHMDGWWLWAARDYHKHLGNRADDHLDDWKYLGHAQVGLIKNWSHLESDPLMEDDQCSKWQDSVCHITLWGSRICSHARLVVLEDTLHLWTHQAHRMTQYTDGRWQVLKVTVSHHPIRVQDLLPCRISCSWIYYVVPVTHREFSCVFEHSVMGRTGVD